MTIDRKVVLTGSMNFTSGAAQNSENVALIASEAVVAAYTAHWQDRLVASVPFTGARNGAAAPMWPGSNRNRRRDGPASPRARLDIHVEARGWRRCRLAERISEPQPLTPFGGEEVMEKGYSIPRN